MAENKIIHTQVQHHQLSQSFSQLFFVLDVQVTGALREADSLLAAADHEMFMGRVFGRPYYMPRPFAMLCTGGNRRPFPHSRVHHVISAVRSVARVEMSLMSLVQVRRGTSAVLYAV